MSDTTPALDIREKIAHIDLMLAQHDQARVSINDILARTDLTLAQHNRVRQEIGMAPWVLVVSSVTAGAALFAAAFAFARLFT